MATDQTVEPMPRLDFAGMTDKKLVSYLKANQAFIGRDDRVATREDMLATADVVADRKATAFLGARAKADILNHAVGSTSEILQAFPSGPLGMTPDDVKAGAAWQSAYRNYDVAFQALRNFNGTYTKVFADELRHERNTRRMARLTASM